MLKVEVPFVEEPRIAEAESVGMSESGLKLFGRTIPVLNGFEEKYNEFTANLKGKEPSPLAYTREMSYQKQSVEGSEEDGAHCFHADERGSSSGSNTASESAKQGESPRYGDESCPLAPATIRQAYGDGGSVHAKEEHDQTDALQPNASRKSHKPIPCPRCNSLETKFCYFNNYNINQPRHFCRRCQRYWTAGGSLRNVPVGAGRRKSKNQQNYCQPHMPLSCLGTRGDPPDAAHQLLSCSTAHSQTPTPQSHPQFQACHTGPLADSSGFPTLESSSAANSIFPAIENPTISSDHIQSTDQQAEQSLIHQSSFSNISNLITDSDRKGTDESVCGSSLSSSCVEANHVSTSHSQSAETGTLSMGAGLPLPWPNGVPLTIYPWTWPSFNNMAGWSNPSLSSISPFPGSSITPFPSSSTNSLSSENTTPVVISAQLAPWAGPSHPGSPWWANSWSNLLPWGGSISDFGTSTAIRSNSNSTEQSCLGKHPLDRQPEESKGSCIWAPKSLRMDDQGEAARISILKSLGLSSSPESIGSGGMFRAFQPIRSMKDSADHAVDTRHDNPAASKIFAAFQECN